MAVAGGDHLAGMSAHAVDPPGELLDIALERQVPAALRLRREQAPAHDGEELLFAGEQRILRAHRNGEPEDPGDPPPRDKRLVAPGRRRDGRPPRLPAP